MIYYIQLKLISINEKIKKNLFICFKVCVVKNVLIEQMDGQVGFAGDHVTLNLSGPDQSVLAAGQVLCDPATPIPITAKFRVS